MPSTQIGGQFVPYSQSLAIRIVLLPLGLIYRVWTFSVRFCYKDPDGLSQIRVYVKLWLLCSGITACFWQENGTEGSGRRKIVTD